LGLAQAGDGVDHLTRKYIDHLNSVVPESRDNQSLALRVCCEVVQPTCNIGNWNLFF
jgi:hypothetical protein